MTELEQKLLTAISSNQIGQVKNLLNELTDLNFTNNYLESPLHIAIEKNNIEIINLILKHEKLNLHIQSYIMGTPLTFAIYSGQAKIAIDLLNKEEVFINEQHPGAISWAILTNHMELLKLLKAKGADFNTLGLKGYHSPPTWALKEIGNSTLNPFDRDSLLYLNYTPLYLAIYAKYANNLIVVDYLLTECNVDPNMPSRGVEYRGDELPLEIAIKRGDKQIVQLLLNYNASPELPNYAEKDAELPMFLRREPIEISQEIQELLEQAKQKKVFSFRV